ncbi:MAG: hypothetical protein WKF35_12905 [Ferruginibacter sp.]
MAAFFSTGSCKVKKANTDNTAEKIKLINADKSFSGLSREKGMKAAFIEYIDSNGVLLKPDLLPVVGANAIDYLIQQNDTSYSLTWQPHNAVVSSGGDMGYTYGIYSLLSKSVDTTLYGTYVNIWKRQSDGSWKFVLNSGNNGVDVQ